MTTTPIEHRYFQLSATKYSALIMESRIMPFNYKQAASAMWELTLGVCSDREGDFGSKVIFIEQISAGTSELV